MKFGNFRYWSIPTLTLLLKQTKTMSGIDNDDNRTGILKFVLEWYIFIMKTTEISCPNKRYNPSCSLCLCQQRNISWIWRSCRPSDERTNQLIIINFEETCVYNFTSTCKLRSIHKLFILHTFVMFWIKMYIILRKLRCTICHWSTGEMEMHF